MPFGILEANMKEITYRYPTPEDAEAMHSLLTRDYERLGITLPHLDERVERGVRLTRFTASYDCGVERRGNKHTVLQFIRKLIAWCVERFRVLHGQE